MLEVISKLDGLPAITQVVIVLCKTALIALFMYGIYKLINKIFDL